MSYLEWDELVLRIGEVYAPEDLIYLLSLTSTDIVEAFKDRVEGNMDKIKDMVQGDEYVPYSAWPYPDNDEDLGGVNND